MLERWRETCRWNWRKEKAKEHNNIGELRGVIMAIRHVTRARTGWDRRTLVITDSLVALGVLAKGRSRSWPLLRLARQAAALILLFDVRLYLRYVESKRNHADGPSRGFPVGVAPAWVEEAERREMWKRIGAAKTS